MLESRRLVQEGAAMSFPKCLSLIVIIGLVLPLAGCARTARNTEGFAAVDTASVKMPMKDAWQTAKEVLREKKFDIYTRDKRGVFVAFSDTKRNLLLIPKRTKYTIALEAESDASTKVTIESMNQVFGVTFLTYPGWHDRKTTDHAAAQDILKAIEAKSTAAPKS
jgi:hypothetical protein